MPSCEAARADKPGQSHLEICGGSPTSPSPGGGARGRRLHSYPLQGGGREGGPAPGSAGVPPASREARTRMRAFGPPCRRDAGAPRQFTDERGREDPRSGCGAGSTPLPTSPLPGGRREDGAARLPVRTSRAFPNGPPTPPPAGEKSKDGVSTAIALGEVAGRSHLEFCGGSAASPSSGGGARGRRLHSSPLQGGGREGGPAPGRAGVPPASREARTRMRAFGPPCRRDAGAPRQFTDERGREDPVRAAEPGQPPSRPPP